jgi:hypothetical protein
VYLHLGGGIYGGRCIGRYENNRMKFERIWKNYFVKTVLELLSLCFSLSMFLLLKLVFFDRFSLHRHNISVSNKWCVFNMQTISLIHKLKFASRAQAVF